MIKISKLRFIVAVLIGLGITVALSYNTMMIFIQSEDVSIRTTSELSKLNGLSNGDIVSIVGTPNFLYTVKSEDTNYYFSLKEYGFDIIIKSSELIETTVPFEFIGMVKRLDEVERSNRLIDSLNEPIDSEALEGINFTEEQLQDIEKQATGKFSTDSYLMSFSPRNTLSNEIVISELFLIFVLSTLGISSIIGGLKYENVKRVSTV